MIYFESTEPYLYYEDPTTEYQKATGVCSGYYNQYGWCMYYWYFDNDHDGKIEHPTIDEIGNIEAEQTHDYMWGYDPTFYESAYNITTKLFFDQAGTPFLEVSFNRDQWFWASEFGYAETYPRVWVELFVNGQQIITACHEECESGDNGRYGFFMGGPTGFTKVIDLTPYYIENNNVEIFLDFDGSDYDIYGDPWYYLKQHTVLYPTKESYQDIEIRLTEPFQSKEINIPVYISNSLEHTNEGMEIFEVKSENIIIESQIEGKSQYPYLITDILTISYVDEYNSKPMKIDIDDTVVVEVNVPGYTQNFTINCTWEYVDSNTIKLVVDEEMYFDNETGLVTKGWSEEYDTYKGLILPPNRSNNYGTLSFTLLPSNYVDTEIEISMEIGNQYAYYGEEDDKYYFLESNEEFEYNEYTKQVIIPFDELIQPSGEAITWEDIELWTQ